MRNTALSDGLHDAGIVMTGAIIVFNEHDQRIASFIPGTLWLGSLSLPENFTLENLPDTVIRTRGDLTTDDAITAAQRLALWQTISGSGGYSRFKDLKTNIFTVLDALGGTYTGFQQELAHVCGASRERILKRLADLVNSGQLERIRHGSRGDTLILPSFERGQHWQHVPALEQPISSIPTSSAYKSTHRPTQNTRKPVPALLRLNKPNKSNKPPMPKQKPIGYQQIPLFHPEALNLEPSTSSLQSRKPGKSPTTAAQAR